MKPTDDELAQYNRENAAAIERLMPFLEANRSTITSQTCGGFYEEHIFLDRDGDWFTAFPTTETMRLAVTGNAGLVSIWPGTITHVDRCPLAHLEEQFANDQDDDALMEFLSVGGVCRTCGCTDDHACPGGCAWAEPGLCTECVGFEPVDQAPRITPVIVKDREGNKIVASLDDAGWRAPTTGLTLVPIDFTPTHFKPVP